MQKSLFLILLTTFFTTLPLLAKDLDLNALVTKATQAHKPLLLFFHKPHCGYCDHMIEFTLKDSMVVDKMEREFLFVDIYTQEKGKITFNDFVGTRREFAKYIGYDFYPTTAFVDGSRKVVHVAPGLHEQDDFLKVLNYISGGYYRQMEFQTYLDTLDFDEEL